MQMELFEDERWSHGPQTEEFRHRTALRMIEGGSILDLGCGDGLFLSMIDRTTYTLEGADISSVAIAQLKEKGINGTVVDLAGGSLPFPDRSFDTVVMLDVLEHLYFPERLLTEALRISNKCVVVGVPNFSSLPARIATLLGKVPENNRPKKGHCYWFNLAALRVVVEKAGGAIEVLETNTFWENRRYVGAILSMLNRLFPSLFALSFVVKIRRI